MVDPRHSQIPTPIPPDFEDRHRLALTLCQHLGINPEHVALGSMQIELGPDHLHRVTWTGLPFDSPELLAAFLSHECDYCGAAVGEPCKTKQRGVTTYPHAYRRASAGDNR